VCVCEKRTPLDWDKAVSPAKAGRSDTSVFVVQSLDEVLADLECDELFTPAKREVDAEARTAAPATRVAVRVTADEVSLVYSLTFNLMTPTVAID